MFTVCHHGGKPKQEVMINKAEGMARWIGTLGRKMVSIRRKKIAEGGTGKIINNSGLERPQATGDRQRAQMSLVLAWAMMMCSGSET